MFKNNIRIDNVDIYSSPSVTIVLVLVEGTEAKTVPV